jgi:hypothetical protein
VIIEFIFVYKTEQVQRILNGGPSLDEPLFTDLEPKVAGSSGDGYIWKYLYTIKPSDIIKFDSTDFIPTPINWETSTEMQQSEIMQLMGL